MSAAPRRVRFTVWSDHLCPWCYVAELRLDHLAREVGDVLEIEWRTFLLQPEPRPKPIERFRGYTQGWVAPDGPGGQEPDAGFRVWTETTPPPSHSLPPAVAAMAVRRVAPEQAASYRRALMHAYFVEHRTISELTVLAAIADEVGIDGAAVAGLLRTEGGALTELVRAEHAAALEAGIHAVPTVVIDDEIPLAGAQSLAAYRRIVARRAGP